MSAPSYKMANWSRLPLTWLIYRSEIVWVIKRSISSFSVYKNLKSVIDSAVLHWTTRLMVFPRNVGFGRCYLVSTRHEILFNIDRNAKPNRNSAAAPKKPEWNKSRESADPTPAFGCLKHLFSTRGGGTPRMKWVGKTPSYLAVKVSFRVACKKIYRGYYTVARRYEFYFWVAEQYFTNEHSVSIDTSVLLET